MSEVWSIKLRLLRNDIQGIKYLNYYSLNPYSVFVDSSVILNLFLDYPFNKFER